jgi:Tol biopolymer transport system component
MVPRQGGEEREIKTLLKGERSPKFESLHLLRSDLDVSRDGQIVFASKNKERDRLYIMDLATREITAEFDFPDLVFLSSPTWSPDGKTLVFSGAGQDGRVDLFTLRIEEGAPPTRHTRDFFNDLDPIFTPDGRAVIFASDRGRWGRAGYTNLFRLDFTDGTITPVTCGRQHDRQPSFSPDGTMMVFSSDREGLRNLHVRMADGRIEQWTSYASGAFNPRFTPGGNHLIFSGYQELALRIFEIARPDSAYAMEVPARCSFTDSWAPPRIEASATRGVAKYSQKFSFDIAQSAVSYDAVYGTLGGFQTALTDVLGNKQYFFLLANSADSKDNFLQSLNVSATYLDRTRRLNYGYGLFHLYDDYYDRTDGFYTERQYGGVLYLGYPISKFRRLESSLIVRQSDRHYYVQDRKRETLLGTGFVSFVHDNSIWDLTGPIDGYRFRLSLGLTQDISNFEHFNRLGIFDARKYYRLGRYSCLAMWVLAQSSSGEEPQRRYLGGSWSLRGYSRRAFYGRHVLLFSNELRFPLIDNLFIKFPLARLGFQAIRGALFFDAGNAWDEEFGRMKGALGIGARVSLGYIMVLRFDFARRTDFKKIDTKTRFDFFFGWNF